MSRRFCDALRMPNWNLLVDLHNQGATICIVTHDPRYAELADRTVHLFDGHIVDEQTAAEQHV
jgi:ABC-type siderophore export system fused ATPase/permease subunit